MPTEIGRRGFLRSAGALTVMPLLGGVATEVHAEPSTPSRPPAPTAVGRRRLGTLEVSSVGLGVQNMTRKYETTVPSHPEMLHIIRTAYDRGVTFFDAAEAYGPLEVERVLGEGVAGLVKQWAERKRATPAQIALAWLLAQKPWIVPIPGTTQMAHMLENTGAADVHFTPAELAELNASVRAVEIRGARLPEFVLALSGVEAPAKSARPGAGQ